MIWGYVGALCNVHWLDRLSLNIERRAASCITTEELPRGRHGNWSLFPPLLGTKAFLISLGQRYTPPPQSRHCTLISTNFLNSHSSCISLSLPPSISNSPALQRNKASAHISGWQLLKAKQRLNTNLAPSASLCELGAGALTTLCLIEEAERLWKAPLNYMWNPQCASILY